MLSCPLLCCALQSPLQAFLNVKILYILFKYIYIYFGCPGSSLKHMGFSLVPKFHIFLSGTQICPLTQAAWLPNAFTENCLSLSLFPQGLCSWLGRGWVFVGFSTAGTLWLRRCDSPIWQGKVKRRSFSSNYNLIWYEISCGTFWGRV